MARRIVEIFIDDLDGATLEDSDHESVRFGLDGIDYRIDLGRRNADELRAVFEPYIAAGTRVARSAQVPRSPKGGNTGEIRSWATANGYQVAQRGRLPGQIMNAYVAAN